ncbi:unnamed protein product [Boreogadus saida]
MCVCERFERKGKMLVVHLAIYRLHPSGLPLCTACAFLITVTVRVCGGQAPLPLGGMDLTTANLILGVWSGLLCPNRWISVASLFLMVKVSQTINSSPERTDLLTRDPTVESPSTNTSWLNPSFILSKVVKRHSPAQRWHRD